MRRRDLFQGGEVRELEQAMSNIHGPDHQALAAYIDLALKTHLEPIKESVTTLAGHVHSMAGKVGELTGKVGAIETTRENDRDGLLEAARSVAKLEGKIDAMPSAVTYAKWWHNPLWMLSAAVFAIGLAVILYVIGPENTRTVLERVPATLPAS
jgi:hypothetical protein